MYLKNIAWDAGDVARFLVAYRDNNSVHYLGRLVLQADIATTKGT
jgi:hypothetical protein